VGGIIRFTSVEVNRPPAMTWAKRPLDFPAR
jgi:hypothetical protein